VSAEIYLVASNLPGSLFIMPCPRGDQLSSDIASYHARGVDTIVSMLAVDEAMLLGLECEGLCCGKAGIVFLSSPITDFGLPEVAVFDALVGNIAGLMRNGHKVAVHCRAGIGRSGMVTAATLIALGFESDVAVEEITRHRGIAIPDTVEQGKFVAEFAKRDRGDSL
jgi:protein-tyrosine phosphatase